LRDTRPQFGADQIGIVERARDRGDRNAGMRRNSADPVLGSSISGGAHVAVYVTLHIVVERFLSLFLAVTAAIKKAHYRLGAR
jgi:hypothetical protein